MNTRTMSRMTGTSSKLSVLAAVMAVGFGATGPAWAAGKTYTLNNDFLLGTIENLNFNVPNQLQVNVVGVGSKFIFVANHDEDSVSKFDTTNVLDPAPPNNIIAPGKEVARYKTYAGAPLIGNGGQPSRIAIDVDGNAYVLNRMSGIGARHRS